MPFSLATGAAATGLENVIHCESYQGTISHSTHHHLTILYLVSDGYQTIHKSPVNERQPKMII